MSPYQENFTKLLCDLNEIGVALSAEKDHDRLLELILTRTMEMTNADGGTLYLLTEDKQLEFKILHNRSLNIHMGGTSEEDITLYPIALFDAEGNPNNHMVSAWAVNSGKTANIEDAYASREFDFSGTRSFDNKTAYRSISFLTVPMTNHENDIIGVLQLINAMEKETGEIIPFSTLDQQLVESLASQAAVAITNKGLIDAQKKLFDSLIQLIADAVDEKSPYTAGHCRRVPVIVKMITHAVNRIDKGPLKGFSMTDDEQYELEVAAWLHDCGKITTPEYVINKGTKLETIFDRIKLVNARFEILKRDLIIESLKSNLRKLNGTGTVDEQNDTLLQSKIKTLIEERDAVRKYNIGAESLTAFDLKRIEKIADSAYTNLDGGLDKLLNDEEVQNLQINRGTLTPSEREIINNHVVVTIKMLKSLPYPKHLGRVPEYAGGHHEKMDGTGYPNKLTRKQMSIPARIMAIADIFEALTAGDRPYKKAMPLSQTLTILGQMKVDDHIDADLFDVFMHEKIYLDYAQEYLDDVQIDAVDFDKIPGYQPLD